LDQKLDLIRWMHQVIFLAVLDLAYFFWRSALGGKRTLTDVGNVRRIVLVNALDRGVALITSETRLLACHLSVVCVMLYESRKVESLLELLAPDSNQSRPSVQVYRIATMSSHRAESENSSREERLLGHANVHSNTLALSLLCGVRFGSEA